MPSSVLDSVAGIALAVSGLGILQRRRPLPGLLLLAAAALWFLGGAGLPLAHRGPLTHALIGYPRARLTTVTQRLVVVVVYAVALGDLLAPSGAGTMICGLAVLAAAAYRIRSTHGIDRLERRTALLCLALMWGVLLVGAGLRAIRVDADGQVLVAYQVAVTLVAVVVLVDLRFGRARRAAVAGLALDLGRTAPRSLRDLLARTLGDPTLSLAYLDADTGRLVGDDGRPVRVDDDLAGRVVTELHDDQGRRVAVLVHDAGVLDDPVLVASVTKLAGMAVTNRRLQAQVADRIREVEASRRRLVFVADAERIRLEAESHAVQDRLERASALLAEQGPDGTALLEQLADGQRAVRDFALGLHPRILRDHGLSAAIQDLASRAPLPVSVAVPDDRFNPDVEAGVYFVCAEALTNVAKYAGASTASVTVTASPDELAVGVSDNGAGGADLLDGSGLTGLIDRLDVLGGRLEVDSPPGRGTTITAVIPLPDQ